VRFQPMQPPPEKMQDQEKIDDDKQGINCQFDQKRPQGFGRAFFHPVADYSPLVSRVVAHARISPQIALRFPCFLLTFHSTKKGKSWLT
jgi:hypothetical protein